MQANPPNFLYLCVWVNYLFFFTLLNDGKYISVVNKNKLYIYRFGDSLPALFAGPK
jgi:hypothetical protein